MPDRMISRVRPSRTCTSDGKKVDTWRVDLPDGASEIVVMLHSTHDQIYFSASGDHKALRGLKWEDSDLAALRNRVMEDVEKAARRYFETDWQPAVALSASLYKTDRESKATVQLSVEMTDLHVDPSRPVGNRGETRVLLNQSPTVFIQRAHDQDFESDGSLDQDNMRFLRERGNCAARVVVDADHREEVLALSRTLESFSLKLMRRLAPDVVRHEGVPSPEDLALILRDAIDAPEIEERDPEEFRM